MKVLPPFLWLLFLLVIAAAISEQVLAACANNASHYSDEILGTCANSGATSQYPCSDTKFDKISWWLVSWDDNSSGYWGVKKSGECHYGGDCYPVFNNPTKFDSATSNVGVFDMVVQNSYCSFPSGNSCQYTAEEHVQIAHLCGATYEDDSDYCMSYQGAWNFTTGMCSTDVTDESTCWANGFAWSGVDQYCYPPPNNGGGRNICYNLGNEGMICTSPILVDVQGNGFDLTDAAGGVQFDIFRNGTKPQIAWTTAGSDDAWLALDRNNNGKIDNAAELFGDHTPQPRPPAGEEPNGFRALAVDDENGDGVIDSHDTIFSSLRLWQDANHDGISQADELHPLAELGVSAISLDYKEAQRRDQYGNLFRYRAKVTGTHGQPFAYDVFLLAQ
jgi:hypothetical protein